MATKATLNGALAREMAEILGDQATELIEALHDMNTAHLTRHDADYWEAATQAGRISSALRDVFSSLARGDYHKAARKLGIEEHDR